MFLLVCTPVGAALKEVGCLEQEAQPFVLYLNGNSGGWSKSTSSASESPVNDRNSTCARPPPYSKSARRHLQVETFTFI